ncbi:transposase [Microcoleus sp. S13_B4]|uniref:transposase n=1 Tax=Microcoleus sp. S13_B4 TaxID=3055408 RepID=UPI002FD68EBF
MPYSTSLTDEEWIILESLRPQILPTKKQTRPPNWAQREILDGIFYQVKNRCNGEDLPCIPAPVLDGILVLQTVAGFYERSIN